jgi:Lrp/AsnC family transcriptional regulator
MDQNHQLDEIDRRIVRDLQRDASLSHAALAERVGASAASVWRRVRTLERAGVLGATVRLASPGALGRSVNVLCQVRMVRQSIEARADFEAFIQSREEIVEC